MFLLILYNNKKKHDILIILTIEDVVTDKDCWNQSIESPRLQINITSLPKIGEITITDSEEVYE